MSTFQKLHVNPDVNRDGSRSVSGYTPETGWRPAGRLMPEVTNYVPSQPPSLAKKLLQARIDSQRAA